VPVFVSDVGGHRIPDALWSSVMVTDHTCGWKVNAKFWEWGECGGFLEFELYFLKCSFCCRRILDVQITIFKWTWKS